MTHTPTPWTLEHYFNTDTVAVATPGGTQVAVCYGEHGDANAAHIVRCVNHFDELIEALRLTQRNLDAMVYMLSSKADPTDKASLQTWREVVQDALARAREEQP